MALSWFWPPGSWDGTETQVQAPLGRQPHPWRDGILALQQRWQVRHGGEWQGRSQQGHLGARLQGREAWCLPCGREDGRLLVDYTLDQIRVTADIKRLGKAMPC